jgi:inactivated superfamily I helicase
MSNENEIAWGFRGPAVMITGPEALAIACCLSERANAIQSSVSLAAADEINARKIKTSLIRVGICLDQMTQSFQV